MATRKEVKKYTIHVAAHLEGFNEWRANISLYGDTGTSFGTIRFTDTLADRNNQINPTGQSTMWMRPDAYNWVLDLLRNEKPVYIWLYDSGQALLSTSAEPVGEGETGT
jgi:hypothetical protein